MTKIFMCSGQVASYLHLRHWTYKFSFQTCCSLP